MVSSFDEVKCICSEYPIEFFINHGVGFGLEILFKNFFNEIDHSLEKILIFEDEFGLAVAEENAHVDVADFFTLFL